MPDGGSIQRIDELDRAATQPLSERPYEFAEWKKVTVNIDYNIDVAHHFYSVPFRSFASLLT